MFIIILLRLFLPHYSIVTVNFFCVLTVPYCVFALYGVLLCTELFLAHDPR